MVPGLSMLSCFQSMFIESGRQVLVWVVTTQSIRDESSTFCTATSISFTSSKDYTPHPLLLTTRLPLSRVVNALRQLESMWVYWTWMEIDQCKLKDTLTKRKLQTRIGHFQVSLCVCFKTSPCVKPFTWKSVDHIFIWKVSHVDSFSHIGIRRLTNGLLYFWFDTR